MTNKRRKTDKLFAWVFVILALAYAIFIPAVVVLSLYNNVPLHKDIQEFAAAFSDFVSPIFSVLAFVGLVFATFFQYAELQDTRAELQRTADAQTAQAQLNALAALLNGVNGDLDYQSNRGNPGNTAILQRQRHEVESEIKAILKRLNVQALGDDPDVENA